MPLDPGIPICSLSAPLAVERLRRRTIYTATGLDVVDPSNHGATGIALGTNHVVILAVRRKAGAVSAVRPVDCSVHCESVNPAQWLLLHVPAALVPVTLVWADMYAGAPVEWSRVDAGGLPVVLTPVLATMDLLSGGSTVAVGEYGSLDCSEAQPLALGDALIVVGARRGAVNSLATASIRVEIADE